MLRHFVGLGFAVLGVACGGDVIASPGQSGDEASGSGAGSTSATTGGNASGAGAAGPTSSGVGAGPSSGSGPVACGGAYITVKFPSTGAALSSACAQTWGASSSSGPVGYYVNGGPAPGIHELTIEGCASTGSEGIRVQVDPGPDVPGGYVASILYTDVQAQQWAPPPDGGGKLVLDKVGAVGDSMDGSYGATLIHGAGEIDIAGEFHVCHVPDENVP